MTHRRLAIAPAPLEAVRRHAADACPEECCGFLLGRDLPGGAVVERALAAENEHPSARSTRYLIPPERVLAAWREARALNLRIVGYYHSHPGRGAEPSGHDLEDAWPAVSYLIVPVAEGVPGRPRSWRLRKDGRGFDEEEVGAVHADDAAPSPAGAGTPGGAFEADVQATRGGASTR